MGSNEDFTSKIRGVEVTQQVPDTDLILLLMEPFEVELEEATLATLRKKSQKTKVNIEEFLALAGEKVSIIEAIFDFLFIEGNPRCVNHGYKQVKKQVTFYSNPTHTKLNSTKYC